MMRLKSKVIEKTRQDKFIVSKKTKEQKPLPQQDVNKLPKERKKFLMALKPKYFQ